MYKFEGKKVAVTGSATGMGRATALEFAKAGAEVVAIDLVAEETAQLIGELKSLTTAAHYVQADLTTAATCHGAIDQAVALAGGLDVLVNVAGGGRKKKNATDWPPANWEIAYDSFLDVTEQGYNQMLDTNLRSAFFCSQAAAKVMLGQESGGKIINFGSSSAHDGMADMAAYAAAKAGVMALTRSLALALGPKITVNTVSPGPIASESFKASYEYTEELREMIPLKRYGRPEEVARTVLFLASEDGDFYTGQTFDPTGGLTMPW